MILAMPIHCPCPLDGVLFSPLLPLPTAQEVLASFSSLSPTAECEFAVHPCLSTFHHNTAPHGPVLQVSSSTCRCHAHSRLGPQWKNALKPLAALFKHPPLLPLRDLFHLFVTTMQMIFCVCSVGHLLPHHIVILLRNDLCRNLCSKHDFFALTSCLRKKLAIPCQKFIWLPTGQYASTLPSPTYSAWIRVESEWIPGGMVGMVGIW